MNTTHLSEARKGIPYVVPGTRYSLWTRILRIISCEYKLVRYLLAVYAEHACIGELPKASCRADDIHNSQASSCFCTFHNEEQHNRILILALTFPENCVHLSPHLGIGMRNWNAEPRLTSCEHGGVTCNTVYLTRKITHKP